MAIKTVQAIINGVTTTLTYNSTSGKYEATITAPSKSSFNLSGGYYPVTIKATDTAGNTTTKDASDTTLGASLRLVVKEKVAPTLAFTYPSSGAYITSNKPTIKWVVKDDDSGVKGSTISITVDNTKLTDGITKTAIAGGYECSYTPSSAMSDGSHTVKIDASDNDGNVATQKSIQFKVDTVPPTLNVTSPTNGLITNQKTVTVAGTTNDATSSPVTVKVNGTAVTVGSNGAFSTSVNLVEGSNTITVVATDSAGKTSTVTRTVTLDTKAPTISVITLTPNPVDGGKTFVVAATVSD